MVKLSDLTGYFASLDQKTLSSIFISEIGKKKPNLNFIRYLISLGAHLDNSRKVYNPFVSPLRLAAKMGHLDIINLLVEFKINLNEDILFKGTALHAAAEHGQLEVVKLLLSLGVNVNIKTSSGVTPLHFAAKSNNLDIVKLLLDSGANIESRSNYSTPIHWAVIGNSVDVVRLLIEKGADLGVINYGCDGYGGEDMNLMQTAMTTSHDIGMSHKVTAESHVIYELLKKASYSRKPKGKVIK